MPLSTTYLCGNFRYFRPPAFLALPKASPIEQSPPVKNLLPVHKRCPAEFPAGRFFISILPPLRLFGNDILFSFFHLLAVFLSDSFLVSPFPDLPKATFHRLSPPFVQPVSLRCFPAALLLFVFHFENLCIVSWMNYLLFLCGNPA